MTAVFGNNQKIKMSVLGKKRNSRFLKKDCKKIQLPFSE